jgi:hypothetical protein
MRGPQVESSPHHGLALVGEDSRVEGFRLRLEACLEGVEVEPFVAAPDAAKQGETVVLHQGHRLLVLHGFSALLAARYHDCNRFPRPG